MSKPKKSKKLSTAQRYRIEEPAWTIVLANCAGLGRSDQEGWIVMSVCEELAEVVRIEGTSQVAQCRVPISCLSEMKVPDRMRVTVSFKPITIDLEELPDEEMEQAIRSEIIAGLLADKLPFIWEKK